MSDYSVRLNPRPTIQALKLNDGHEVLIVDDLLDYPERLVRLARDTQAEFVHPAGNAFPGYQLLMPPDFCALLDDFFRLHVRSRLGGRRSQQMYARMSRVTLSPELLDARQRICHRDNVDVAEHQMICASVLYLFDQPELGGTVFFRPRITQQETEQLVADANTFTKEAFQSKYAWPPGYITQSNTYFETVGRVPAKWNRIIFYDGGIFHSSDIGNPQQLVHGVGRLTVNGFFTCTRRAT